MRDRLSLFQSDRTDPVSLFRQHFILFHALYRLEQELAASHRGQLQINPLQIVLTPNTAPDGSPQLDRPDPLRNYYLDLNHLYQTGKEELKALLRSFWQRLRQNDHRTEALAVLGLADPVDETSIRRRYRKLVMRHHPDRGGDTQQLQMLNAAIATLLPTKS